MVDDILARNKVHGEVSREPANWVVAKVPNGELKDVLYHKADGEAIAKVRNDAPHLSSNPHNSIILRWSVCFTSLKVLWYHEPPSAHPSLEGDTVVLVHHTYAYQVCWY